MTTLTTLSDHLAAAYEAPEDDEARATYRVESPDAADWAMRKLAKVQAELESSGQEAAVQHRRINEWLETVQRRLERDSAFFESLLIDWHRRLCDAELAEVGTWAKVAHKTRRLPSGEVSARMAPDSWAATNEAEFIAWAEANRPLDCNLVKVEKTARISMIKGTFKAAGGGAGFAYDEVTGELVPGITVTPGEVHYSVKVEP